MRSMVILDRQTQKWPLEELARKTKLPIPVFQGMKDKQIGNVIGLSVDGDKLIAQIELLSGQDFLEEEFNISSEIDITEALVFSAAIFQKVKHGR